MFHKDTQIDFSKGLIFNLLLKNDLKRRLQRLKTHYAL